MEQIKQFYAARGLVPRIEGATVVGAYYPLKVLIYDSCGDGFGAGVFAETFDDIFLIGLCPVFTRV